MRNDEGAGSGGKAEADEDNRDEPSPVADFPMRKWNLRLYLLDEEGNERPADVFTKVVYHLHPTFENPDQSTIWPITPPSSNHWLTRRAY